MSEVQVENSTTQNLIEKAKAEYAKLGYILPTGASKYVQPYITTHGKKAADAIAEITEFNGLIEDYTLPLDRVEATSLGHVQIKLQDGSVKSYTPQVSFLSGLSTRVNSRIGIERASGQFLSTLRNHSPEATGIWADLMDFFFRQLHAKQSKSKRSHNVKLRCLKSHPAGKWGLKDPMIRAIVSEEYSDQNSHLWLINSLQRLAPSGSSD